MPAVKIDYVRLFFSADSMKLAITAFQKKKKVENRKAA